MTKALWGGLASGERNGRYGTKDVFVPGPSEAIDVRRYFPKQPVVSFKSSIHRHWESLL